MITILGAGGPIANELVKLLVPKQRVRLVGRTPKLLPGTEVFAADLAEPEQARSAIEGSTIVHLLVGLQYDLKVWREFWPRIMTNTIEACKRSGARLIFFDNIYMYGDVSHMTEENPYAPVSRKGEVRAQIATQLMREVQAGNLHAMIARAADFYGPLTEHGVPNLLVFKPYAAGAKASWLVNADVPHSFTFTPDAARGLAMLQERDSAWNQVWHLPTAPDPPTGREFIRMAAQEFGVEPKFRVLSRPMMKVVGWFNSEIGETYEMLYQADRPYVFDSSKFALAFGFSGTPYSEGIRLAAQSYQQS